MTDGIARAALGLLNELLAASEAQEMEEADSYVVLSLDPEFGGLTLFGGFPDPVSALAWAERHETDLNRGNGPDEVPFVATVYPVFNPGST